MNRSYGYRVVKILIGLLVMSLGMVLIRKSVLGFNAWGVFHDGLSETTGLTFGRITQLVGLIVIVIALFFKVYPREGTLLNLILVGIFFDLFDDLSFLNYQDVMIGKLIYLIIGLTLITFGRATYITAHLGTGPRDGLFIGIVKTTGISVKYIKPSIEAVVLVTGFLLGGVVGLGTIVMTLFSGYLVEQFFKMYGYDPKETKEGG